MKSYKDKEYFIFELVLCINKICIGVAIGVAFIIMYNETLIHAGGACEIL